MKTHQKVIIGGFGGLTPVIMNLLIIDINVVLAKFTVITAIGYFIRVVILFYLGGIMAFLHKNENNAVKLFELGIVAPALITAAMNAGNLPASTPRITSIASVYVYAQTTAREDIKKPSIQKETEQEESAIMQLLRGLTGSIPEWKLYMLRGNAYLDKREFDRAIALYDKAIAFKPDYGLAYAKRGYAYHLKNDIDHAIADYNKAIELRPDLWAAHTNVGIIYINKGEYDKAIDFLDRAIFNLTKAIESGFEPADLAYANRGEAYRLSRQYDHAITDLTKAIELNPKSQGWVYASRGGAYFTKGKYDQAIADLIKAIELNPGFAWAYRIRAKAYLSKGELSLSKSDSKKADKLEASHNK